MIKIYTDGSCLKNPGPGGWAAVIIENDQERVISGNEKNTTNNQMELLATIKALEEFSSKENITIVTDSKYVKDGITIWIRKWEVNNWKTSNKQSVKNIHLWKKLSELNNKHVVEWVWVKGHSNDPLNDMVDEMAKRAAKI
tara:strand:+ start:121 stop:543 length:423 start_codon:yes stop_codon:yes gene_type:complete